MENVKNKIENSLIIPEKENIFSKMFKWIKKIFTKKEDKVFDSEAYDIQAQNITIPKAVKMPTKFESVEDIDENSLEYLSKLSDYELDKLDQMYEQQMEEAKNEIAKLDDILQSYRKAIKKFQEQVGENMS